MLTHGMDSTWCRLRILVLLVCLISAVPVSAQEPDSTQHWKFQVAIYVWGASIGGTTNGGADIDIPFSDLVDRLDIGFMGAVTMRKGKWSIGLDNIYLNVSDEIGTEIDLGGGPMDVSLDIKLEGLISTLNIGYTVVKTQGLRLVLFGGARYLWLEPKLDVSAVVDSSLTNVLLGASGDLWDGVVGFKGTVLLAEKWRIHYYLDVGTGENDFSLQTFAGLGHDFGKVRVGGGYRYVKWNFDDDDPGGKVFDLLDLSGPYFGASFPL